MNSNREVGIKKYLAYFDSIYYYIIQKNARDKGVIVVQEITNTQFFRVQKDQEYQVTDVIASVYEALMEKGYNPVSQIVGYVMSGDPTYITSHNGARSLIMRVERDEIIEVLLEEYIKNTLEKK